MILKNGIIISGEYVGWSIKVLDDTEGDTGGFYIILYNQETEEVFDYWFEKYIFLENQLADFNVEWK